MRLTPTIPPSWRTPFWRTVRFSVPPKTMGRPVGPCRWDALARLAAQPADGDLGQVREIAARRAPPRRLPRHQHQGSRRGLAPTVA
eukprot:15432482-Alexandrium_andersonii.AAC.1